MILTMLFALAMVPQSASYRDCLNAGDAAEGVQSAMQDCANRDFERQDARLNQAYKMKMAALPATRRTMLRGLQRQWIADRDRRCRVRGNGSLDRMVAVECLTKETMGRTSWLERYR